jgi:PIN domain nuclease of toxin-antitoxin system
MRPRLLLDTHILIRWLIEPRRLSREQTRVLERALRMMEPVAISAITLLEIAVLVSEGHLRLKTTLDEFFSDLQGNPAVQELPLSYEVAVEIAFLGALKDPADRAIAATARVHGLRLLTSDQRIVESGLVAVIE